MENKKYLDKVIGSLVRGTKVDYENNLLSFPFPILIPHHSPTPYSLRLSHSRFLLSLSLSRTNGTFYSHCRNIFGLTKEETEYVWNMYKDNILEKIKDGE